MLEQYAYKHQQTQSWGEHSFMNAEFGTEPGAHQEPRRTKMCRIVLPSAPKPDSSTVFGKTDQVSATNL